MTKLKLLIVAILLFTTITSLQLWSASSTNKATRTNLSQTTNQAATNAKETNVVASQQNSPAQKRSFILEYFEMGGTFMYPLLLLSIIGLTVIVERFWYFSHQKLNIDELTEKVREKIITGGAEVALIFCEKEDTMSSHILADGLRLHEAGIDRVEKTMETRGGIEIGLLERGLSILAAVANLAPLLGFLGTVTGMMLSFKKIAAADTVSAKLVSGGIFEALVTTAVGLIIAIPAFAFHNVFVHKIDKFATEVEKSSATVINTMVLEDKKKQNEGK